MNYTQRNICIYVS